MSPNLAALYAFVEVVKVTNHTGLISNVFVIQKEFFQPSTSSPFTQQMFLVVSLAL